VLTRRRFVGRGGRRARHAARRGCSAPHDRRQAHTAFDALGIAVVLSTHDPDQAFLCADLVALLHEGRLARLGPTAEVITSTALRETYRIDVEVVTISHGGTR
jgi:ABC-type cobalamin/Fe3+-siderophores transport system ATPase subunit